jgi:hypothetical protein
VHALSELRHLKWRVVYALCAGRLTAWLFGLVLRVYAAMSDIAAADGFISAVERRFVYSGWPFYGYGWTNLHVSRFAVAARRHLYNREAVRVRRPTTSRPPRLACIGQFVGLLGFPKRVLQACPVPLVIADIGYANRHAEYLRDCAVAYRAFDANAAADTSGDIAAFLKAADVDLVLNIGQKPFVYDLLDHVDAPCVANYCVGSDLLHHPNVDIQFHGQPEADYFVVEGRMFCGTTARTFGGSRVHPIMGYIDPRGLALDAPRPWVDRDPLIVCHGSLFKFANAQFLDVLCDVLADDRRIELVLVGKDNAQALQSITRHATDRDVAGQVHYEGEFASLRNDAGDVDAGGWHRLVDLLQRARLAPDPFPIGGGSSRFEAYALGTPSPHMGVRFEREAWCRPQPGNCEIPGLLIRRATAWTVDEYRHLCRLCLGDASYADGLSHEQVALARHVADVRRFWRDILDGYEAWRASAARAREAA